MSHHTLHKLGGVILTNPKFAHNVGGALRACSCFGVPSLWWTGSRVTLDVKNGERLPREERMRGFRDVEMVRDDRPFDRLPEGATPVGVEVRPNAENLFAFEHPDNPVFVFGPEDGSLSRTVLGQCHRFVFLPTAHCLNLATAVTAVLYDWRLKRWKAGLDPTLTLGDCVNQGDGGFPENEDALVGVSPEGMGRGHTSRTRTFR
jgi:tRNA(Leu) C34 or U34 (ribose-2'-O)-methylase TrmL